MKTGNISAAMPLAPALLAFVKPLYQDVDGRTRFEEVERISALARELYQPPDTESERELELLLLFQGLGAWLGKLGNFSRTVLGLGSEIESRELRRVSESLARLDAPRTEAEIALAAARLIDESGLRGLVQRIASARREGTTPEEVVTLIASEETIAPAWMPANGRARLEARLADRREFCRAIVAEGL